jgi:hypothetical protein
VTDKGAPTHANLNVLQLLELARTIVWEISPQVSGGIEDLMLELVRAIDDDEALLRDRVAISLLEGKRVEDWMKRRSGTCQIS